MSSKGREESHIPALDGLRGVAILLVLLFHTCTAPLDITSNPIGRGLIHIASVGWTGVDLFFVLSGFLITRILLDAKPATNYFKVFYMRRILRIFPIYYLSLVLIFWLWPFLSAHTAFFQLHNLGSFGPSEQLWYWFNIVNLRTAFYPLLVPMVTHYWTLSIEEQFYAVWPAIVFYLKERWIVAVAGFGIVAALVLRNLPAVHAINGHYPNFIYRFTPFRVDTLLFGALLAILFRHVDARRLLAPALVVFLTSLTALWLWASPDPARGSYSFTGLAVLYSALLTVCVSSRAAGRVFRWNFLQAMGKYSYSVYLLHPLVITWTNVPLGHALRNSALMDRYPYGSHVAIAAIDICMCFLVARVTWALIESPMLKLKRYFRYSMLDKTEAEEAAEKSQPLPA